MICIITPEKEKLATTFIKAHIELLPDLKTVLYGGRFPRYYDEGYPLIPGTFIDRITNLLGKRVSGLTEEQIRDRYLTEYLRTHGIHVVFVEYGTTAVAVLNACKAADKPMVVNFHGYDAYKYDVLETTGKRYPELFEYGSAFIAVSREMAQQLISLGAPPEKVKFSNTCGVDISLFKQADPRHAPPHFVAVGRFVNKKSPILTLLAFHKVWTQLPSARLTLMGDGPLYETAKQFVKAMRMEDAVSLPGDTAHEMVATAMFQARAFVQHSVRDGLGDSEGTPVAVMEAHGAGLPVISTRHAGIKDVVMKNETGFLVDEGDWEGMADNMLRLAQEPELAGRMGLAGHQRALKHYTIERSIAGLWEILSDVITKTTLPSPPD